VERARGMRAMPDEPQRPLEKRLQTAIANVFEGTEEELANVEAAFARIARIIDVAELRLWTGVNVRDVRPSVGWDVLRERPDLEVRGRPDLEARWLTTHREFLQTGFLQVLPSLIDIALGARDAEGIAWHEVQHVFENVMATNAELDVLHEETDSMREEVGKVRGMCYHRAGLALAPQRHDPHSPDLGQKVGRQGHSGGRRNSDRPARR
jgi:hypothetical protein